MNVTRTAMLAILLGSMYRAEAGTDGAVTSGPGTATAETKPEAVVIPEGMKAEIFHFRKEKIRDETGQELAETFKHPSVTIPMPVPTKEQLLAIFSAPSEGEGSRAAEQKFILDLVNDAFYLQAREQINDAREDADKRNDKEFRVSANVIDYSKLDISALANMPASERGNKISDDDMKTFILDYSSIMPAALGKDAKKIKAQADLLEKGLRTVKTDKKVLDVLNTCLTVWAANTSSMDENRAVYDMLNSRAEKWLKAEPKNVMDSIM